MTTVKKGLCLLLSLSVFFSLPMSAVASSNIVINGVEYDLVQSHLEVSSCDKLTTGDVQILTEYEGYTVTAVQASAFYGCTGITSVTVPGSVTSVSKKAFMNCTDLETAVFQGSDTTLGESVFDGCNSLISVSLPSNLRELKAYSFKGCSTLATCVFPDSIEKIGDYAFMNCGSLKEVTLSKNTVILGTEVFSACGGITAFRVDTQNSAYKTVDGVLFNKTGTQLIAYPAGRTIVNYTVPDGVTYLLPMAFAKSQELMYVSLPKSLETIGKYAFSECGKLNTVILNEGLTEIEDMAFQRCKSLSALTLPSTLENYDNAFFNCGLTDVTLSEGITSVDEKAFDSCTSLANISLPQSLNTIEMGAFHNCNALQNINIPFGVTTIDDEAFNGIKNTVTLSVADCSPAMKYAIDKNIAYNLIGEKVLPKISGAKELQWEKSGILTVSPSDFRYQWTSSDPSVIRVDAQGKITALKKGSAVIRANVEGFEQTYDEITITVTFTFWQKIVYFFRNLFGMIS